MVIFSSSSEFKDICEDEPEPLLYKFFDCRRCEILFAKLSSEPGRKLESDDDAKSETMIGTESILVELDDTRVKERDTVQVGEREDPLVQ